jgi:hypothetical protein
MSAIAKPIREWDDVPALTTTRRRDGDVITRRRKQLAAELMLALTVARLATASADGDGKAHPQDGASDEIGAGHYMWYIGYASPGGRGGEGAWALDAVDGPGAAFLTAGGNVGDDMLLAEVAMVADEARVEVTPATGDYALIVDLARRQGDWEIVDIACR